jgi:hypothetical protein
VKWGIPSEPAWAYLREKHPDLVAKGAEAFRITTAYDAGRKATVDALLAADVEGVAKMARVCTKTLGGPVQRAGGSSSDGLRSGGDDPDQLSRRTPAGNPRA